MENKISKKWIKIMYYANRERIKMEIIFENQQRFDQSTSPNVIFKLMTFNDYNVSIII